MFSKAQYGNSYEETWIHAILRHHRALFSEPQPLRTFYLGGGTPSLISLEGLEVLMKEFRFKSDCEKTMECNPENLTKAGIEGLAALGFNRISLGVQSFSAPHLKRLERLSTQKNIENALHWISESFQNFSIDLMLGIPDQTFEVAMKDLETALHHIPPHLSVYILTVSDDHIYKVHPAIKDRLTADETIAETYLEICKKIKAAGYRHYEVSNFSKPNFESRHNQNYWNTDSSYLALGPGAHGYLSSSQKIRFQNWKDPKTWEKSETGIETEEYLDPSQQDLERFYLKLRSGAPLFRYEIPRHDYLNALEEEGLIEWSSRGLNLSERGWLYMEYVAERLLV